MPSRSARIPGQPAYFCVAKIPQSGPARPLVVLSGSQTEFVADFASSVPTFAGSIDAS